MCGSGKCSVYTCIFIQRRTHHAGVNECGVDGGAKGIGGTFNRRVSNISSELLLLTYLCREFLDNPCSMVNIIEQEFQHEDSQKSSSVTGVDIHSYSVPYLSQ
jgi:hypothetical protein